MRTADCGDARAATGMRTALAAAARDYGTPVYVLDMAAVARAAAEVESAFGGPWLRHYSLKANDLPAVTSFLLGRGWAASVVSTGEWQHARSGGAASDGLAFEGIGKTDWQLDCAVRESAAGAPLRWLSAESADEIAQLRLLADRYGLGRRGRAPVDLLVRLNPQVQPETRAELAVGAAASKFGMSREEIAGLAVRGQLDGGGLRLRGVHVHVGSDLRDVRAWAQAGVRAAALLADLARVVPGGMLDTICFGGGFPVGQAAPAPAQFRGALEAALAEAGLALPATAGHRARPLPGRTGRLARQQRAARAPGPAGGTAGRARRGHDRAHPPRALRQPPPGARDRDQIGPRTPRRSRPSWKGRYARAPTRSARISCRRCAAATWWPSRTLAPTRRRSPRATTAGRSRPRCCSGPAGHCSAVIAPRSNSEGKPVPMKSFADLRRPLLGIAAIMLVAGLAACASDGTGAAGLTTAESQAANSETAIVPTQQGSTADDIYPLVTGPQVTPFNEQMFQDQMYQPMLWYGGEPGNEFGFYNQMSIGNPPVWSNGDTVVTVTLKKYYWSDGQPVTARDITFFMNLLEADKDNYGLYTPGEFPDNVKSWVAVNASTVRFTLTKAYSPEWFDTAELTDITPFPQQEWDRTSASGADGNYDLTKSGAVAVNKFLISQAQQLDTYATNPIWQTVDGPWRLKAFSTRGDIDLVPNQHYSGPVKPKLKELIERPFTSDTSEFNALLAGTGLTEGYVPSEDNSQIPALEAAGYKIYSTPTYGINYIVINFNSPTAGVPVPPALHPAGAAAGREPAAGRQVRLQRGGNANLRAGAARSRIAVHHRLRAGQPVPVQRVRGGQLADQPRLVDPQGRH